MFITVHDRTHSSDAIILRVDRINRVMPLDRWYSRIYVETNEADFPVKVIDCYEDVDEICTLLEEAQES